MYLAMDTAGPRASLAVGDGRGGVLAEISPEVGARSSRALMPSVEALMAGAGLRPTDLEGVIVGRGPGSYTGVRIAAAAAKGLVHALGCPLFAYGSLSAMSEGTEEIGRALLPLLPARRGEAFAACHRLHADGLEELAPPALLAAGAAAELALEHAAVAIGSGASRLGDALRTAGVRVDAALGDRVAAGLLRLHAAQEGDGRVADPRTWEPRYLRPDGDSGQPTG
jgi:tRNA threonylcarbamoyl adenosine modification protein YeaZ